MTLNLPAIPPAVWPLLLWVLPFAALAYWQRNTLTPAKALSIFESDGVLSARQILAWVVSLYGMLMRAAGRLDDAGLNACFQCSFILFGIGGLVKAAAVVGPTTINAKKVEGDLVAEKNEVKPE
jgi:hypothetical protein